MKNIISKTDIKDMINKKYAKMFCCEDISLIENYEEAISDTEQTWHCHHRLETDLNISMQELKESNRYFNVEAKYLIFLKPYEHLHLHGTNIRQSTREKLSKSARKYWDVEENRIVQRNKLKERYKDPDLLKKISELCTGELNGMYGKKHTDEAKAKQRQKRIEYFQNPANREHMAEIAKNREYTQERRNNISKAQKGVKKSHYTNPPKLKLINDIGEIKYMRKPNAIQFIGRHPNMGWKIEEEN